jgi:hypothetical protein
MRPTDLKSLPQCPSRTTPPPRQLPARQPNIEVSSLKVGSTLERNRGRLLTRQATPCPHNFDHLSGVENVQILFVIRSVFLFRRRLRRSRAGRWLFLLYSLLLLRMPLLHLLGLLLMALLDLLLSAFVRILFCETLVVFFLLAFKLLPVFLFLCVHLLLLLLIFLVLLRVTGVWRSGSLERRKITWMDSATRIIAGWRVSWSSIASSCVSRTAVNCATFAGGHDSATPECCRSRSGSNRRLATVFRST